MEVNLTKVDSRVTVAVTKGSTEEQLLGAVQRAETASDECATLYDSFDDRFLGAKASAPSLDNDGDALVVGAMYYNSVTLVTHIWNGTGWDTTSLSANDIKVAYESNANTNAFTDVEKQMLAEGEHIGTPLHTLTIQHKFDHTESAGISTGCDITNNGDGTIDISVGEAYIRAIDDHHSTLYVAEVGATTNLALAENTHNIIYLDYNSGTPIFAVTSDPNVVTITDKVPAFSIFREGLVLHTRDIRGHNIDNTAKHQKHMFFTEREVHSSGGIIADEGTLHISVTSSLFYFQLVPLISDAFDTSGTDTFSRYYSDGTTGFTEQTSQSTIDNIHYDDGSGILAELGVSKYGIEWIYLILDDAHSHLIHVYGTASYASQAEASAATAPSSLPNMIATFGTLIGRTIVQKSATELSDVQSSLTTQFSSSLATYHNNTAGIQGGALNDYYHLTLAEYNALIALLP